MYDGYVEKGFNTQPPEGGWVSMPKTFAKNILFQHTAARRRLDGKGKTYYVGSRVSTHSRPKAAGTFLTDSKGRLIVSTHSRPKAAGPLRKLALCFIFQFQHTAARRRLAAVSVFLAL